MRAGCLHSKTKITYENNPNPMKKLQLLFATTLALIGSAVALHAGQPVSVSAHFTGVDNSGIDNVQYTSLTNLAMDPTGATVESAGAPNFVTPNWNNLGRYGDVSSGILDSSGVDSGLHMQWDSVSTYSSGAYINISDGSPNSKLMDGFDSTDWAGGPPGAWTAGATYGANGNQKPAEYVGNIQAWLAAKGATNGYSVVLYVQGWHGWYGTSEHWIQAVTGGNPSWWNMTVGGDVTPRIYCKDNGVFTGTFSQVPASSTSLAGATSSGDYIVFNGLTNDAILIENVEPDGSYQAGKIFGFQIVATPNTPIPSQPVATPNPVYATSPLAVVEQAYSPVSPVTSYQWQTDGGSGGALTNIPGATSATLNEVPVDLLANYTLVLDCVVANSYGTVTSAPVSVTVYPAVAPVVSRDTNPTNVYTFVGGSVTFGAGIAGSTPITNVWQVNKGSGFVGIGSPVTTNYDLALANIQLTDAGTYQFVGTNSFGSTNSTPVTLTVQADPAAPTPSQAYAYDVFTNGPVAYWRLNEAVDPATATYQAYDSSGHNLNATYGVGVGKVGIVGPQSPAFVGFESGNTAASFTNATANGTLVVPPLNLSSANVTITAWIYPTLDTHTGAGLLFNTTPTSAAGLGFGGNTDANVSSPTYGQAELGYTWNNNGFNSGLFPPTNTWSFVALTITPTNGTLYLCYFDGTKTNVLKKVNTRANSLEAFNSSGTTWIGGHPTGTGTIFDGSIDEVAVFNSAFTDGQVLNLYFTAQGGGSAPVISQNPVTIAGTSVANTFAGQSVSLTAYGLGYPTPGYQWQGGTGGVFHNLANDSHLSGATSSTLTIKTTMADALDYRLVLNNTYGSVTSSIATINLTPVPVNGLWTVNFSFCGGNNGMPSTPYSGPGVLGSGTFWNAITGGQVANTTSFRDDGVTSSGISFQATNYPGNWYQPNLASPLTKMLDGYVNTQTEFVITNLANGTYNLVVFGLAGTYQDTNRGTAFTVNGITINNVFQQDWMFAPGDNTALFANVVVSDGSIVIGETPTGTQSDGSANGEPDFNGVQIQAVSIDTVVLTNTYSGGSGGTLTLSWPSGTLVSATNLLGPWVPVAGAASPFQVSVTNKAEFFRVKVQ